jgi:hypothetical protein
MRIQFATFLLMIFIALGFAILRTKNAYLLMIPLMILLAISDSPNIDGSDCFDNALARLSTLDVLQLSLSLINVVKIIALFATRVYL